MTWPRRRPDVDGMSWMSWMNVLAKSFSPSQAEGVGNFALATNNFANFYELAMGLVNYVPCAVPDVTDSR